MEVQDYMSVFSPFFLSSFLFLVSLLLVCRLVTVHILFEIKLIHVTHEVITTSGQRYEGSGVSFRRREAKREAARDVLALIPQPGTLPCTSTCIAVSHRPPAVTPTDTQSMIAALRNDGHELHLTGKSLSIKTTEIIWSLELHGWRPFHKFDSGKLSSSLIGYPIFSDRELVFRIRFRVREERDGDIVCP